MTAPALYRIVDRYPYQEREDEYRNLTLEEAAVRMDDLTGVGEDVILADIEEDPDVLPWEFTDPETGREVTMTRESVPEAAAMSTTDGLGG